MAHYLQVLTQAKKAGRSHITSHEISEYTHVNATQIRRDLSGFGTFGKRGVGYNVDALIGEISAILRTAGQHNIVLVGAGHLGTAIAQADVFADHGFSIAAIVDADPAKIGKPCGSLLVRSPDDLPQIVEDEQVIVGVVAVPADNAQDVADTLVRSGVRIVFNYSGALIDVPTDVTVHTTSPAVELLYALYFHLA
jgi:redox-sensing transcriptional repressor